MLRKFRNLDKMEILQNAINRLTAENEQLKKKNGNLERLLDIQFKKVVGLEKEWKKLNAENEELKNEIELLTEN